MPTDITTVFAGVVLAGLVAVFFVYRAELRRMRRRTAPPPPVERVPDPRPSAAEVRTATVYVLPTARDRWDADATAVLRVLPGGRDAR